MGQRAKLGTYFRQWYVKKKKKPKHFNIQCLIIKTATRDILYARN